MERSDDGPEGVRAGGPNNRGIRTNWILRNGKGGRVVEGAPLLKEKTSLRFHGFEPRAKPETTLERSDDGLEEVRAEGPNIPRRPTNNALVAQSEARRFTKP